MSIRSSVLAPSRLRARFAFLAVATLVIPTLAVALSAPHAAAADTRLLADFEGDAEGFAMAGSSTSRTCETGHGCFIRVNPLQSGQYTRARNADLDIAIQDDFVFSFRFRVPESRSNTDSSIVLEFGGGSLHVTLTEQGGSNNLVSLYINGAYRQAGRWSTSEWYEGRIVVTHATRATQLELVGPTGTVIGRSQTVINNFAMDRVTGIQMLGVPWGGSGGKYDYDNVRLEGGLGAATLRSGLSGVLDSDWRVARPEPFGGPTGCAGLGSQNTLGFVTDDRAGGACAPVALDVPHVPGQTVALHIDHGDLNALAARETVESYRLAFDSAVTFTTTADVAFKAADVFVNQHQVGTLEAWRFGAVRTLCFKAVGAAACSADDTLPVAARTAPPPRHAAWDAPLRVTARNLVEVRVADPPASVSGLTVTVHAAAMTLAAPATFILHGWAAPSWDFSKPETCLDGLGPSDRPQGGTEWQAESRDALVARAITVFGQNPWQEPFGLNPRFSYCGKDPVAQSGAGFAARLGQLEQDGYNGPAWVVGHSMGGLVTRYATEVLRPAGHQVVTHLVTTGTPHRGSCLGLGSSNQHFATLAGPHALEQAVLLADYANGNLASADLAPDSALIRTLNGGPRHSGMAYSALAGLYPIDGPGICELYDSAGGLDVTAQLSDFIVPVHSARFMGGHDGAASFRTFDEWCTPHFDLPGTPAYYHDPQSQAHIIEALFGPAATYDGPERTLYDCTVGPLVDGTKVFVTEVRDAGGRVIDYSVQLIDEAKGVAVDVRDATVSAGVGAWNGVRAGGSWLAEQGIRALARGYGGPIIFFGGASGASDLTPLTRSVTLSGADAHVVLLTPLGEDRLVLRLIKPDGTAVTASDADVLRRVATDDVRSDGWFLKDPAPGPWTLEITGPATDETLAFSLRVNEAGVGAVTLSRDADAFNVGDTARVTATFAAPEDATDVALVARVDDGVTVRDLALTAGADAWTVDVPVQVASTTTVYVTAFGTLADGAAFERRTTVELPWAATVDYRVDALTLSTSGAWRGADVTATVDVCGADAGAPTAGVTVVVDQGGRTVATATVPPAAAGGCVTVEPTWRAVAGGADAVTARVVSVITDRDPGNNALTVGFNVDPLGRTVARLTGTAGGDGWFRDVVTVDFVTQGAATAVNPVEFQLDSGPVTAFTGPFTVTSAGEHTLRYRAVGGALAAPEPWRTTPVKIDLAPPTTTIGVTGDAFGPDGTRFVGPAATFTATPTDDLSGVAETFLGEAGAATATTGPVTLAGASRATLVQAWSTDVAGNVEDAVSVAVAFDGQAPVATATVAPAMFHDRVTREHTVTFTATDPLAAGFASGVAEIGCRITAADGRAHEALPCPQPLRLDFDDGRYTLAYWAVDRVGNVGPERTVSFRVDGTAPVVRLETQAPRSVVDTRTGIELRGDADGDGFADAVEELWGSDPELSVSVPRSRQVLNHWMFGSLDPWADVSQAGLAAVATRENSPKDWRPAPSDLPSPLRTSVAAPDGVDALDSHAAAVVFTGVGGTAGVRQAVDANLRGVSGVAFDVQIDDAVTDVFVILDAELPASGRVVPFTASVPASALARDTWTRVTFGPADFTGPDVIGVTDFATLRPRGVTFGVTVGSDVNAWFDDEHARLDNALLFVHQREPLQPGDVAYVAGVIVAAVDAATHADPEVSAAVATLGLDAAARAVADALLAAEPREPVAALLEEAERKRDEARAAAADAARDAEAAFAEQAAPVADATAPARAEAENAAAAAADAAAAAREAARDAALEAAPQPTPPSETAPVTDYAAELVAFAEAALAPHVASAAGTGASAAADAARVAARDTRHVNVGPTLTVHAFATDPIGNGGFAGLTSVTAALDDGPAVPTTRTNGLWRWTFDVTAFKPGPVTLSVTATDGLGQATTVTRDLILAPATGASVCAASPAGYVAATMCPYGTFVDQTEAFATEA